MRLIIDIPEWKYKSICEGIEASKRCGVVGIDPDIHEAIYKGKPYEEQSQGEWIKITRKGTVPVEYVCSCCGRKIYDNYELSIPMSEFYPYCHCGADMRGDKE